MVSTSDPTNRGMFGVLLLLFLLLLLLTGVTRMEEWGGGGGLWCSEDDVGTIASWKVKVSVDTGTGREWDAVGDGDLGAGFDVVVVKNIGRAVVAFCTMPMTDGKSARNEVTVVG